MGAVALLAGVVRAGAAEGTDGEAMFNNACRTCHTLRDGDNRLGPNLRGVVGRRAGSVAGYAYSPALAAADLVWDRTTLDRFVAAPDSVAPGNAMRPFGGIASAEDRARLIAYLASVR
jgi:cytochrome c